MRRPTAATVGADVGSSGDDLWRIVIMKSTMRHTFAWRREVARAVLEHPRAWPTPREVPTVGQATGPSDPAEHARQVATDPGLPGWARQVVGLLLDGDDATLDLLETLTTEAAWLFSKGRDWPGERPSR
jgi:hypothetical protein